MDSSDCAVFVREEPIQLPAWFDDNIFLAVPDIDDWFEWDSLPCPVFSPTVSDASSRVSTALWPPTKVESCSSADSSYGLVSMDGLTGRQDLAAEGIDLSGNSGEALLAGYLHVSDNDLQRMYHGLIAQPASNGNGEMHNGGLFEVDAWANGDGETHDHTRERHHANAGLGNGDYRGMSPGFSLSMSPPRPVMVAGAGAALSLHGSPGASLPDNASMLQMQSAYMQLQPTTSQADLRLLPESVEPQIMHLPAQLRARVAELQAKLDKHCQVFLEVAGSTDPTKAMELAALPAGVGHEGSQWIEVHVTKELLMFRNFAISQYIDRHQSCALISAQSTEEVLHQMLSASLESFFLERLRPQVCKFWGLLHFKNPKPNQQEKKIMAEYSGRTFRQVTDWFTNWRARNWRKAMIKNRRRWMKVIFAVYAAVVIGKLRQRRESALLALLETGNELPLKASVKI